MFLDNFLDVFFVKIHKFLMQIDTYFENDRFRMYPIFGLKTRVLGQIRSTF